MSFSRIFHRPSIFFGVSDVTCSAWNVFSEGIFFSTRSRGSLSPYSTIEVSLNMRLVSNMTSYFHSIFHCTKSFLEKGPFGTQTNNAPFRTQIIWLHTVHPTIFICSATMIDCQRLYPAEIYQERLSSTFGAWSNNHNNLNDLKCMTLYEHWLLANMHRTYIYIYIEGEMEVHGPICNPTTSSNQVGHPWGTQLLLPCVFWEIWSKFTMSQRFYLVGRFQPIWIICSSNWIISPNFRDENK